MVALAPRSQVSLVAAFALVGLLLASLVLLTSATEDAARFGQLYVSLLLLNVVGLLVLVGLIGLNLVSLLRSYRLRAPGSRLTLRLVVMFVLLSVMPASVLYYSAVQFLQRGIDSWFDVRVEQALDDSLELSRAALDLRLRENLRRTQEVADQLIDLRPEFAALMLTELRNELDADELTLLNLRGRVLASAGDSVRLVPDRPAKRVLQQVQRGDVYAGLDPSPDGGLVSRVVVAIPNFDAGMERYALQALIPISDRLGDLAEDVQEAFETYRQLSYMRQPLKTSFLLTLSLVLMVSLLAAVWAAFASAKRLAAPVRDLAIGTQAVAEGRYGQTLPVKSSDEMGFLVMSFNAMTRKLAIAQEDAQRSQLEVERQRAYLETVLGSISSGVLTLQRDGCVRTANLAAARTLGTTRRQLTGQPLDSIAASDPRFLALVGVIQRNLHREQWEEQVLLSGGGRQVLICRGSRLTEDQGMVLVFDDMTALVRAERNAAWADVARRLAHEIKNPLTPIQLAAERLRRKYLGTVAPEMAGVLDRSTHTIIQQVQALKQMVDAFNEYARPPQLQLGTVNIASLIAEVLYLYRDNPEGVELAERVPDRELRVEADAGRLRQLLHNLVKNAVEAVRDGGGHRVEVAACRRRAERGDYLEITVSDDGPGLPREADIDIFEPYVSNKAKGSGLGLAISKKIVEEHGGEIHAEDGALGGARLVVRLPLSSAPNEEIV